MAKPDKKLSGGPESPPEWYERVSHEFIRVLDLPPEEREAELGTLELELRTEVESLLAHHSERSFLEELRLEHRFETTASGLPVPEAIDGYPVIGLLGCGGMGTVYEVEQPTVGRRVALKVLNAIGDEDSRARFALEVSTLARLDHPSIARIFGAGEDASAGLPRPYFTMELVDGVRIDDWTRRRGCSVGEIVDLVVRVCDAIEHAHGRGIIHRDIKPGNVLVKKDGVPVVLDFGIARPADDVSLAPVTGSQRSLLGTLAYMSPEQCSFDGDAVDERSDIYSIAALLYELVAGRPPIKTEGLTLFQAARKICEVAPKRLERGDGVSKDLNAILLQGLEKRSANRYASVAAFAQDLRNFRLGHPVLARYSKYRRMTSWAKRHPTATTALAATGILTIAVSVAVAFAYWLMLRPYSIQFSPSRDAVWLMSVMGTKVHSWPWRVSNIATMVDDDGNKIAVLAKAEGPTIVAYRFSDPDQPIWSTESFEFKPPGRDIDSEAVLNLNVGICSAGDYLPESPGDELLLSHHSSMLGDTVIRVLDSTRRVRFEAWHSGKLTGITWLPASGQLFCVGFNSRRPWRDRVGSIPGHQWPYVVFSLDIQDAWVGRDLLITAYGTDGGTPLEWYRWFGPVRLLHRIPQCLPSIDDSSLRRGSEQVAFVLNVEGSRPEGVVAGGEYVYILLDANGLEISRTASEQYLTSFQNGELPDHNAWQLLPLSELPRPRVEGQAE